LLPEFAASQNNGKLSREYSPVLNDSLYFLDFLVVEDSIRVTGPAGEVNPAYWHFTRETGMMKFSLPDTILVKTPSVRVEYIRLLDFLNKEYRLREPITVVDTTDTDTAEVMTVARKSTGVADLFGDVDLNRSGSLTRGFTVGNRQDLSLESGLRLDLNGQITDDISITATLTDRSTPIQPDGSTQNLREFDRVYIQMQNEHGQLELGDVDVSFTESDFAILNRRVQGGAIKALTGVGTYRAAMSVARGEFRIQRFNGIEGLQGPYRLEGENNDEFIVILAGSERVFVNGIEVQRGIENAYTIDYSLGEITFTNNLLVTDETRIVVEFQFLNQNFTRTLIAAGASEDRLADGRLRVAATFLRESDNSNPNTQISLSDNDIELLRNLGDDVEDTFVSGADSTGFQENPDDVLYARVDTVLNGEPFEIFRHIPGDSASVFRVRFTNFGQGNGSYRRVGGTVNGLLFEWVGPGAGSYEPVIGLDAPREQQLMSLRSDYALSDRIKLFGEWSFSDFDRNRFSDLDSDDNIDHAFLAGLRIDSLQSGIGSFSAGFSQRYTGKNFEFLDRVRDVEFDRIWNIEDPDRNEEEWISEAELSWNPSDNSSITARGALNRRDFFDGERFEVIVSSNEAGAPFLNANSNWVKSDDRFVNQTGDWFKLIGSTGYLFRIGETEITPFLNWETENRTQQSQSDSLLAGSIEFYDLNPGIRLAAGTFSVSAGGGYRFNKRAQNGELIRESVSRTQRFGLTFQPSAIFRSENQLQFRQKDTEDAFLGESQSPRSRGVLMRSVNNYLFSEGGVEGELLYEANTERRALLQETFIEAGPELGQFFWDDLNGDGVQQLDEFFPEVNSNEGTFLRQFIPADELLPVVDLKVRFRNRIIFSDLFKRGENGLSLFLRGLRFNSTVEFRETSTEPNLKKVYLLNPSALRNPETTISGQRILRQELRWSDDENTLDLTARFSGNDLLFQRSAGLEEKKVRLYEVEGSYQISERVRILSEFGYSTDANFSSRFINRGFDITTRTARPGIRVFINRSAENESGFIFTRKKDTFFENSEARSTIIGITNTTRLFLFNVLQNNLRLQVKNSEVRGASSSLGEFELTEGAGRGLTLNWNLSSTYRFSSFLRGTLQYDGRTVPGSNIIQTMRFVVSAVF